MKICPFCAEEIQDAAIKCKHCGEFLDPARQLYLEQEKRPWYFRTTFIVIAFLSVGPLALPLIWWRPRTSPVWKIVLTIVILLLSWALYLGTVKSLQVLEEYFRMLDSL